MLWLQKICETMYLFPSTPLNKGLKSSIVSRGAWDACNYHEGNKLLGFLPLLVLTNVFVPISFGFTCNFRMLHRWDVTGKLEMKMESH